LKEALEGLKVVEVGNILAGPFCGTVMADFGAEVIKVEPPKEGDLIRGMGRIKNLWFAVEGRNKKTVTLNLKDQRGKELLIELLKDEVKTNIVLFPGNASQFSTKADALLYLSLLSGRNAEFLIGQHLNSAIAIKKSNVQVIPTGYLLIDGGRPSSVEYISNTRPIPRDKKEIALSTAVAGELLGMRLIYLEAGSGAEVAVPTEMIKYVSEGLSLPLLVGGGIKTTEQFTDAFDAGADIVVVGNAFESEPSRISEFVQQTRAYNAGILK